MTIKNAKRNFLIDEAIRLFLERSISEVTIKEIAKGSGIGEATVYRYFSNRTKLIVACALKLQEQVSEKFLLLNSIASGYERLSAFYTVFSGIFKSDPKLYRFLSEFDAYCINESVSDLAEYADNMDKFKSFFFHAYRDGLHDRSVRLVDNTELFYYSTTHAVLSLCKKLATGGDLLPQDHFLDKKAEIDTLIGVILAFLKN